MYVGVNNVKMNKNMFVVIDIVNIMIIIMLNAQIIFYLNF